MDNTGRVTLDCETTTLFEATYSGDSNSEIEVCMLFKNCSEYCHGRQEDGSIASDNLETTFNTVA